jgi:hypothetical protein
MDKVQKEKFVSVNFSHAVFCLLSACDKSVMQALVWLPMVLLNASYVNLRKRHIFKQQIWEKISSYVQVNTVAESNRRPHTMLLWDPHYHCILLWDPLCHTVLFWDPYSYAMLFWDPHSYALLFWDPHSYAILFWDPNSHTVLLWDSHTHVILLWYSHCQTWGPYSHTILLGDPHPHTMLLWNPHSHTILFWDPPSDTILLWDPHSEIILLWYPYPRTIWLCCFDILILSFYSFCVMVTLVQNLSSSGLLFDKIKIKMYRTIIMPVVVCGGVQWRSG